MTKYEERFERLATRGNPIGASALLQRVEEGPASRVETVRVPRRRLSGPVLAAIVFGAVLVGGVLWSLFTSRSVDVVETPDRSGIEWIETGNEAQFLGRLAAGPGGFLREGGAMIEGGSGLEFSPDGQTWSDVELPGWDGPLGFPTVETSNDHWLLMLDDGSNMNAWASDDGVTWSGVVWPDGLGDTVSEVIGSGDGFLAVSRDVFGAGTTLWWSSDGSQWAELDDSMPGDPDLANLRGTSGGIVWSPFVPDLHSSSPIFHSTDGETWIEGLIELPPELTGSPTRWNVTVVEAVGDQWIAIGQVSRTAADPILQVWTSPDAVEWTARPMPVFGLVDGRAVDVFQSAVIADRLVVAPTLVPVSPREDGIVIGSGTVTSTGEIWSTADGRSWTLLLRTDAEIGAVAGRTIDDSTAIGLWMSRPPNDDQQQPTVTTAISADPQDLDQRGLDLQDEILADGTVTREELEQALEGWKNCMEERGLVGVEFEIDPRGGWSSTYGSPDPFAGEAEDAACRQSYVNRVEDEL